jgi:FMN phosphatase YigB (HAD superfamily)
MDLEPAEAIYVGDNPVNDIDPPNSIGMTTIQFKGCGKYAQAKGCTQPTYEIARHLELAGILERDFAIRV